jgi:uncharacterized repeat protein (TIGR01451 family)
VIAGNAVFYYLKVKNAGPANALITLVDTLPSGIAFNSYIASQGTCSHAAGVVTCNLGTVPYLQTYCSNKKTAHYFDCRRHSH